MARELKRYGLAIGVFVSLGVLFFALPEPAHAADISYKVEIEGLKNNNDAINYVNNQCSATALLVAVAAYPYNVSFDVNSGAMSYSTNLFWKSCGRGNTRSLAITGYPADNSWGGQATCQIAGTYHAGPGVPTYDCIKYTWGDGGHFAGYATLGCGGQYNYACVNGGSNPSGHFRSNVEVPELQPPTWPVSRPVTGLSGAIPNWSQRKLTSGSHTFARPGAYCAWFKYNDDASNPRHLWGQAGGGGCVDISIRISWTVSNYNLNPTIDIPSSDQVVPSALGTFAVTGRVTNTGPTASRQNINWRLTEIIYRNAGEAIPTPPAGGTSELPCAFFGKRGGATIPGYSCNNNAALTGTEASGYGYPGSNTKTYTKSDFNIGDEKVGTRICYVMSVRQFNQDTENWRHSTPRCAIISKAPKVQVLGGDLIVGRSLLSSRYNVKTSTMRQASGLFYGSLTEYAITATGKIEGMASASGFQGGSGSADMCAASLGLLSFNNTTSSGSCALGNFANNTVAPGDALSAFFGRLSSQNTAATSLNVRDLAANTVHKVTTSASTIRLSSTGSVPANKWVVVYAPGKTVVITSNIQYTTGAISGSQSPPQVVIIAGKIVVADSVNQVDSWLVTTGANATINTCGVGASFSETASPTATVCGTPLRVNGPTITSHLLLRRTAGSEPPTRMGEPAEIFNLRPDAYLWMTNQFGGAQKVPTVSSKELPPRF